jgi:dipeptidyl aminopeptidase/acylaminoacyl peptidase
MRSAFPPAQLLLAGLLAACAQPVAAPAGVDFDALFRPATTVEILAVEAEWRARDVAARGIVEEGASSVTVLGDLTTVRVFSHLVGEHRHYGAVLVPAGAAARSLPVLVVAHSGDAGTSVSEVAARLTLMGPQARGFAVVVPSFRSESITAGGVTYRSGGEPSLWDGDVDDALAFLNVALRRVPEADPERIGVLGTSRGATVALLMAIRDPRIDLVSEMAGPTDFFDPWVRGLMEEALREGPRPLLGVRMLHDRFLRPLADGLITPARFRRELVRRSPVLWAARLPSVQVHHGSLDTTVPPAQARVLVAALRRLDRAAARDEWLEYPGLGHSTAAFDHGRTVAFLNRLRRGG